MHGGCRRLFCDRFPTFSHIRTIRPILRRRSRSDFPKLEGVFKHFAANIGEKEDWGRVPLSIGQEYYSFAQPCALLMSRERPWILRLHLWVMTPRPASVQRPPWWRERCARLAIETINGMAKTAAMTDAAMAKILEAAKTKA